MRFFSSFHKAEHTQAFFVTGTATGLYACFFGLGTVPSSAYIIRGSKFTWVSQVTTVVAATAIKSSIAISLLRFAIERRYIWSIYALILILIGTAIGCVISTITFCHPIEGNWNPLLAKCGPWKRQNISAMVWLIVSIFTDLCCTLLPWSVFAAKDHLATLLLTYYSIRMIVRRLPLPRRSKISVMLVLGFGSVSCIAAIVKAPFVEKPKNGPEAYSEFLFPPTGKYRSRLT